MAAFLLYRPARMSNTAQLPIAPLLPKILAAARSAPIVVSAPTGSGKSTCVPSTLTALGRVLVVEPRRVACRALAARVAYLRGCAPGTDVGWIVRDEHRVHDGAAITFVTPGVALRLVQSGDVANYAAIVLDEFHERSFDTDLLLCLLQVRRAAPAAPFALVVMSATLEGDRLAAHLGGLHLAGLGRTFPIETRWPPGNPSLPSRRGLDERVADALESCERDPGDVLVFLPGKAEIARVAQTLAARSRGRWDIATLHGAMTLREQGDVLQPRTGASRARRVVLATNVAETSLTIPGVGVVIDSGLVRGMVYRAGRGYLSVMPIARDAAEQRAGRAGRVGPGVSLRLWSQAAVLDDVTLPEIHRGSLVNLTLSALACSPRGMDLPWLDPPRSFAVAAAMAELTALGCVAGGAITDAGIRLFSLPLDVGLARLLAEGAAAPRSIVSLGLTPTSASPRPPPREGAAATPGHSGDGQAELPSLGALSEPTLLLAAALSVGRPLFRRAEAGVDAYGGARRRPGAVPPGSGDLRGAGCDAVALIELLRASDLSEQDVDSKALAEARAAVTRFRKLGFGDRAWSGPVPRRALAELLMRIWPECAQVRRDQKRGRFTWSSGATEMELDESSAVRAADTEALLVLDSRAVATQGRSGTGLLITAAMPVPLAWLASAGLGDDRAGSPEMRDGRLLVTVSQTYAGKVLATREESPRGEAARLAVRDLILAGRCMKRALPALRERYELAALGAQVARELRLPDDTPLPPLPEWLLGRLATLGLEGGDDLALLDVEDLLPPEPAEIVAQTIARSYPTTLDISDARYQIEYQVAARRAVFHQVAGTRKEPPSQMHLPRLAGFRLFWEHKNRVQPIGGRG